METPNYQTDTAAIDQADHLLMAWLLGQNCIIFVSSQSSISNESTGENCVKKIRRELGKKSVKVA